MRKFIFVLLLAFAASSPSSAEQTYYPPDQELWSALDREIHKLAMSEDTHVAIHALMNKVQDEARIRAARAKALEDRSKEPVKDH